MRALASIGLSLTLLSPLAHAAPPAPRIAKTSEALDIVRPTLQKLGKLTEGLSAETRRQVKNWPLMHTVLVLTDFGSPVDKPVKVTQLKNGVKIETADSKFLVGERKGKVVYAAKGEVDGPIGTTTRWKHAARVQASASGVRATGNVEFDGSFDIREKR